MPRKRKSVRKRKSRVDREKVEMLASFGCTIMEIAKFFIVDESVIRKDYKDELNRGKEEMKLRLRQLQWKYAEQGNTSLLIFLGKNYLNQTDKQQVDMTGNLEAVLKECGFEESKIGKKDTKSGKVLESDRIPSDQKPVSGSQLDRSLPN
tara:strand:- start:3103 stop:3552 length:450 start_codon:yes stop_codon:yes gene_type:complete